MDDSSRKTVPPATNDKALNSFCTRLCSCFSSLGVTTAHQDHVVISNKGGKKSPLPLYCLSTVTDLTFRLDFLLKSGFLIGN